MKTIPCTEWISMDLLNSEFAHYSEEQIWTDDTEKIAHVAEALLLVIIFVDIKTLKYNFGPIFK